jgi:hypothetical protein
MVDLHERNGKSLKICTNLFSKFCPFKAVMKQWSAARDRLIFTCCTIIPGRLVYCIIIPVNSCEL